MDPDYYIRMAELQDRHWWYEGRRQILATLIKKLELPPDAQVLEAGCGPGANLTMLEKFGRVSAFEPGDFALRRARQAGASEVREGHLPDGIPFSGPFDLVCAFDVIEHIDNDLASVRALCGVTKQNGYAVFTVPAFQFLWSAHDDINHHKRRYNKKNFAEILRRGGYEIEMISYYNFWLFPLAVAVRMVKKVMGRDNEDDVKMPKSAAMNDTLRTVFAMERFTLPHVAFPFGLSLVAVCRKRRKE